MNFGEKLKEGFGSIKKVRMVWREIKKITL